VNVVYKYPIEIASKQTLLLPVGFYVIRVGLDLNGNPCIWAIVDPAKSEAEMTVHIVGTGFVVPENMVNRHIGSFVQGSFIWHAFLD
jgi:hypothetical protein